jgi:hypothetical protein
VYSGHLLAVAASIEAPEELVPAAHRERRRTAGDGIRDRRATSRKIGRDQRLLAILSAADVEEIDFERRWVARADRNDVELHGTPRSARCQHGDVPAIGVDVQIARVQVPDDDSLDGAHAARSQYGRACPRSVTIAWSPSIAV